MEQWKTVPDLPVGYEISNKGNMRICYADHVEEVRSSKCGEYLAFCILGKQYMVHQMVANAFVEKPDVQVKRLCVKHKDGNKCNNDASNLCWVSSAENFSNSPKSRIFDATSGTLFSSMLCVSAYYGVPAVILAKYIDSGKELCGHVFVSGQHVEETEIRDCIDVSATTIESIFTSLEDMDLSTVQTYMKQYGAE